jgi:hypothetical protein
MGRSFAETDRVAKLIPVGPGITIDSAMTKVPELKALYDGEADVRELIDAERDLASPATDPRARPHKPDLDEMGIAQYHEVKPHRPDAKRPRKPTLDEMGPGVEAIPAKKSDGPRSTLGRPGMHGGFKPRRR